MKLFNLWTKNGALNSRPVFEAFAEGAKQLGYSVEYNMPKSKGIDVIWSVLWQGTMAKSQVIWQRNMANKTPIVVLEVGALNRGKLWKVGVDGINNRAYFGPSDNDDTRARSLNIEMKDWRHKDGPILIAAQHNKSAQWGSPESQDIWTVQTMKEIRKQTDRKIILRPHPRFLWTPSWTPSNFEIQKPNKLANTYDDFDFDVDSAYCVVNYSSNPGILAALNGVPIFTTKHSLAHKVGNINMSDINEPSTPDRQQWLNDLVYTEWSTEEIATGEPLNRLTSRL